MDCICINEQMLNNLNEEIFNPKHCACRLVKRMLQLPCNTNETNQAKTLYSLEKLRANFKWNKLSPFLFLDSI